MSKEELKNKKDTAYLALKKLLKGMSLKEATKFFYECREKLEEETKIS